MNDGTWPRWKPSRSAAWAEILDRSYSHPLEAQVAQAMLGTKQRSDLLRTELEGAPPLTTPYDDDNRLDRQLRTVPKLISIRQRLGLADRFYNRPFLRMARAAGDRFERRREE